MQYMSSPPPILTVTKWSPGFYAKYLRATLPIYSSCSMYACRRLANESVFVLVPFHCDLA